MIEINGFVGKIGKLEGTVSFDGRVIEYFGFGHPESTRIHVNQIKDARAGRKGDSLILEVDYDQGSYRTIIEPVNEAELKEIMILLKEKTL